jgi:hypothetical protein
LPGEMLQVAWSADDIHLFDETGIRRGGKEAIPSKLS